MLTDVGCCRTLNEDAIACLIPRSDERNAKRGTLAVVADGMGGHAAGEIASKLAVQTIFKTYYSSRRRPPGALATAFAAANHAVYTRGLQDSTCNGMGTTCTAAVVLNDHLFVAHVGDSRAYVLRGYALIQLTLDDSMVGQLVLDGVLSPDEARVHPQRNVLLKALGYHPALKPTVWRKGMPLTDGDLVILCTDGITDPIDESSIIHAVKRLAPIEACSALIAQARRAGGADNASIGILAIRTAETLVSEPVREPRPTRALHVRVQP
jgi:protein phosphatase